jgi:hypothetical protein
VSEKEVPTQPIKVEEVVRELIRQRSPEEKPVYLMSDKQIEGRLDLKHRTIEVAVDIQNCDFLACVLTMKGFAMSFMPIAKPLAFALFTFSGSRFDGRVAFRSAREVAFGPSRRPTAGFRCLRWRAQLHQKRRNYPMDPYGRQPPPVVTAFPRQTQVRNTLARQP